MCVREKGRLQERERARHGLSVPIHSFVCARQYDGACSNIQAKIHACDACSDWPCRLIEKSSESLGTCSQRERKCGGFSQECSRKSWRLGMSLENRRMLLLIDHSMLYGLFKYCFTDLRTDGDLTLNGNDSVGCLGISGLVSETSAPRTLPLPPPLSPSLLPT